MLFRAARFEQLRSPHCHSFQKSSPAPGWWDPFSAQSRLLHDCEKTHGLTVSLLFPKTCGIFVRRDPLIRSPYLHFVNSGISGHILRVETQRCLRHSHGCFRMLIAFACSTVLLQLRWLQSVPPPLCTATATLRCSAHASTLAWNCNCTLLASSSRQFQTITLLLGLHRSHCNVHG